MTTAILIPCYNEEKHAGAVIAEARKYGVVIACDDGSTDRTHEVALEAGAIVAHNYAIVHGAGNNTMQGFNRIKYPLVYKAIITMDGDGQHDPNDIPKLLEPILDNVADVVIGSRFLGDISSMPKYRKFGIKMITFAYNVLAKQKLTDAQCCFRAFKPEYLMRLKVTETGFAFSTEMIIKLRAMGCHIVEVPVRTIYHQGLSANSTLSPVRHGLSVMLRTLYWRYKVEICGQI